MSKGNRTAKKSPVHAFPVPPEGYQLLFTVTCTKCGAKEPTFSMEGRFPTHCSPTNGRGVCARSGAEFLSGEKRRVKWRVVEKVVAPEATESHEAPSTPHAVGAPESVPDPKGHGGQNRSVTNSSTSAGVSRKMTRVEVERRYYSSAFEDSNEARYREWQELTTGSVSVVARPSAPQGTGRRR